MARKTAPKPIRPSPMMNETRQPKRKTKPPPAPRQRQNVQHNPVSSARLGFNLPDPKPPRIKLSTDRSNDKLIHFEVDRNTAAAIYRSIKRTRFQLKGGIEIKGEQDRLELLEQQLTQLGVGHV